MCVREREREREINIRQIRLVRLYLFTYLSAQVGYDTKSIFKRSLRGFPFLRPVKGPSPPYDLPIPGERIIGFILF